MRGTLTPDETIAVTQRRYREARALGLSDKCIRFGYLDNPFRHEHAHLTLLAEATKMLHARATKTPRCIASKRNWYARNKEKKQARKAAA